MITLVLTRSVHTHSMKIDLVFFLLWTRSLAALLFYIIYDWFEILKKKKLVLLIEIFLRKSFVISVILV